MERKLVQCGHDDLIISNLDGLTLQEAIGYLQSKIDSYESNPKFSGFTFKISVEYWGYDGGVEIFINHYRPETDKEFDARVAKAEKEKAKKIAKKERAKEKARQLLAENEAAEREEYERLKAKFG